MRSHRVTVSWNCSSRRSPSRICSRLTRAGKRTAVLIGLRTIERLFGMSMDGRFCVRFSGSQPSVVTRDLLDGSGLAFKERGLHELQASPAPRAAFALIRVASRRSASGDYKSALAFASG